MSNRDFDRTGSPGCRSNPANGVPTLRRHARSAPSGRGFRIAALVYAVAILSVVVWFNLPTIRAWLP